METIAIRFHEVGGPEVLRAETVNLPLPGPGEVRIRHTAIGLNFIDTYHRSGLYPVPTLPATPGVEAAGIITAMGPGTEGWALGQRVAYVLGERGAYAHDRNAPADRLVPIDPAVSDDIAATLMVKGLTAWYLLHRTVAIKPGDRILVHAAAGGVGQFVCQWAAHIGAEVIGTVSTAAKAEVARAHGCHHVVMYTEEDVAKCVRRITGGAGVHVAYDGVGQATWSASLDSLARFGTLVSFGQSSGKIPPFDPALLAAKGSLYLTRPTLFHYIDARRDLEEGAGQLMDLVRLGILTPQIGARVPLSQAAAAHADLEARQTVGSTVLIPE
jgi:NADPH2:quinone reductase